MTFAPRFSPDGQKVIMSLLRDDGNSNIYAMDLRSRTTTRLTNSSCDRHLAVLFARRQPGSCSHPTAAASRRST